ncbi:MAG: hypothetical protein RLZZ382_360 [Bacteroidota bacterium]|jgi:hypothetical protein
MRKILLPLILLIITLSCENKNSDGPLVNRGTEKAPIYYVSVNAKNGDKSEKIVEFFISEEIVKNLHLSGDKIERICKDAVLYADWNAKFKPTYEHSESASIVYEKKDHKIIAIMSGTAENAFGVPDNISTFISFDEKGKMITDKEGIPEIY